MALADRGAIEQILWVLLDNARRYAPAGPITVRIEPDATPDEEPRLLVVIADEGPGGSPGGDVTLRIGRPGAAFELVLPSSGRDTDTA